MKEDMAKLTLMLMVKNEADRYLKMVLDEASRYVDNMVILDDHSTDQTVEICKSYPKLELLQSLSPNTNNESQRREYLWNLTASTDPEWILALDADEVMDDNFKRNVRSLIDNAGDLKWFTFTFYHFWHSMNQYRADKLWKPELNTGGLRLVKFVPGYPYVWNTNELHCGSVPKNIYGYFPGQQTPYRVKHYGYAGSREEAQGKYDFYVSKDPDGKMCLRSHLDSIVDDEVITKEWIE